MVTESTQGPEASKDRPERSARSILHNPYLWAFVLGIIGLTLIRPLMRHIPEPPPLLSQVPAFELVSDSGEGFGTEQLAGDVYVANFFFTRCASICPRLTASMGRLQDRLNAEGVEGVRLVSFSVDPEYDTPERLRTYAALHGVDSERWTLVTGEQEKIRRLLIDGFRTPMGDPQMEQGTLVDIAHTGKFVLVDGNGGIRGYYDSDEQGLDQIFHRSRHVLKEARRARKAGRAQGAD